MVEIMATTFSGVTLVISLMILWYTLKPRAIQIIERKGSDRELRKQAIITPSGTFVVPEKRAPVINDDEALYDREREN